MTEQRLTLTGTKQPSPRPLTPRQQHAIDTIRAAGPAGLTSDELGAILHQYRRDNGGSGHHQDDRCDYCVSEGRQVGDSLRWHGRVYKRGNKAWTLVEHRNTKPERQVDGYDPRSAEIPF